MDTLDKQHQDCKKYGNQELSFLDGQNYQLCLQHWLENTEQKKILQARIQDSSSLKTPVHQKCFFSIFFCLKKKNIFKNPYFQKTPKVYGSLEWTGVLSELESCSLACQIFSNQML